MVIKLTKEQASARRANSRRAIDTRPTIERARDIVYSGSRLGVESAIKRLDRTDLQSKFGSYELSTTFDPKDRLWCVCVL